MLLSRLSFQNLKRPNHTATIPCKIIHAQAKIPPKPTKLLRSLMGTLLSHKYLFKKIYVEKGFIFLFFLLFFIFLDFSFVFPRFFPQFSPTPHESHLDWRLGAAVNLESLNDGQDFVLIFILKSIQVFILNFKFVPHFIECC